MLSVNARRLTKSSLESLRYFEDHTVGEARPKNRDSKRHSILSKPSRTGDASEVEDIGKVSKLTKIRENTQLGSGNI